MIEATNNPYRPPQGAVFDLPESDERMPRPRHVSFAVVLLWITLVIQAAGLAFIWRLFRIASLEFLIMAGVITAIWALTAWLVAMIERGRNWARFTFLIFFLVQAPLSILSLAFTLMAAPLAALSTLLQLLLQLAGLVMLFIPPAGAWFRGDPE